MVLLGFSIGFCLLWIMVTLGTWFLSLFEQGQVMLRGLFRVVYEFYCKTGSRIVLLYNLV